MQDWKWHTKNRAGGRAGIRRTCFCRSDIFSCFAFLVDPVWAIINFEYCVGLISVIWYMTAALWCWTEPIRALTFLSIQLVILIANRQLITFALLSRLETVGECGVEMYISTGWAKKVTSSWYFLVFSFFKYSIHYTFVVVAYSNIIFIKWRCHRVLRLLV